MTYHPGEKSARAYSLMAQWTKDPPAVQQTWVRSLGQEDPLEKEMATHSAILTWKIPWTEEPGRLYSLWGCKESDTTKHTTSQGPLEILVKVTVLRQRLSTDI